MVRDYVIQLLDLKAKRSKKEHVLIANSQVLLPQAIPDLPLRVNLSQS